MKYHLASVLKFLLFCDLLLIKNTYVTGRLKFAGSYLAIFARQVRADTNDLTIQYIRSPLWLRWSRTFRPFCFHTVFSFRPGSKESQNVNSEVYEFSYLVLLPKCMFLKDDSAARPSLFPVCKSSRNRL